MAAQRVTFFIDGFNVYHSIKHGHKEYLWLDYRTFAEIFRGRSSRIVEILHFTAYAYWKSPESIKRHKNYVTALKSRGVTPVFGKFKWRDKMCEKRGISAVFGKGRSKLRCDGKFVEHVEKQSDVNLAIHLFRRAHEDAFDEAAVVSGDSDLVPAVRALKEVFPKKKVALIRPFARQCLELEQVVDSVRRLRLHHLRTAQLPDKMALPGGKVIERPAEWR